LHIKDFLKQRTCQPTHLLIVADGHGPSGEKVSQYIIEQLPKIMNEEVDNVLDDYDIDPSNSDSYRIACQDKKYHIAIKNSIQLSFKKLNAHLKHQQFDSLLSGSTLTISLIIGEFIYCGNVGDSTAILLKQKKGYQVERPDDLVPFEGEPFQISVDHKPNDYGERARIQKMKGEVRQSSKSQGVDNSNGVYRVWIKDKDFPGLAMSRSIGDKLA
jgi:serine/threonine protein phosphatase PrpC